MRFCCILVSAGLLVVTSLSGKGLAQCRFEDPTALETKGAYGDVITADLNQDGKADIVSTSQADDLLVFFGAGAGSFQPLVRLALPRQAFKVEVADLNRDGKLDLVVLEQDGIAILISRGGGAFAPPVEYLDVGSSHSLVVADLDRDGNVDLAVGKNSGNAAILRGKGDGTFGPLVTLAYHGSLVAAGDFNGDGMPDLALLGRAPLQVLFGDGTGLFPNVVSTSLELTPDGVIAGDLNGDGKTDLVVTNSGEPGLTVTSLLSRGSGSFSSRQIASSTARSYVDSYGGQRLVLADLDRDGHRDVLVRTNDVFPGDYTNGAGLGALTFFRGSKSGFFELPVSLPANMSMRGSVLAIADFDGDGRPDVVTPGSNGQVEFLYVFFNSCGTYEWVLPSSARAEGAGGAFYTTDLSIFNPGEAGSLTLKFLGHDVDGRSGPTATFSLPAYGSNTYRDVLGTVFRLTSGYGGLLIRSDRPDLAVIGQTSTPGGGGSFGQSVPALARSEGIGPAAKWVRSIPGIREDGAFRTNLILVNFSDERIAVSVRLYVDGSELASKFYPLLPKQMTQVPRVVRDLGVTGDIGNGALLVRLFVPGGGLLPTALLEAYAAVIDNATNDPRTILAR